MADATTTVKGKLQLAGMFAGTASAPIIATTATPQITRLGIGVAPDATVPFTAQRDGTAAYIQSATAATSTTLAFRDATTTKWNITKTGAADQSLIFGHSDGTTLMEFRHGERRVFMHGTPANEHHPYISTGIGTWTAVTGGLYTRFFTGITQFAGGFNQRNLGGGAAEDVLTSANVNFSDATWFFANKIQASSWNTRGTFYGYDATVIHPEVLGTLSIASLADSGGDIQVTTTTPHGLANGWSVTISGSHVSANDSWVIANASGSTFTLNDSTFVATGTGTVQPHIYKETNNHHALNQISCKGTYVVGYESNTLINAGAVGRTMAFSCTLDEANTYASYNNLALLPTNYARWGSTGYKVHGMGAGEVGTGVLINHSGPGSFKRAIVVENKDSFETFCVSGTGNIGVRRAVNHTTGLFAALTIGYTSAGALSTSSADGIALGNDLLLFRAGTNVGQFQGSLNVTGAVNLVSSDGSSVLGLVEQSPAPPAAVANSVKLYAADSAGTTVLRYIDSASNIITLGAAGAGGYISSVANTNTIDHTVSGGGQLTSVIPTTATPQLTGLGIGVASPATGLGITVNTANAQTVAGMTIDSAGKAQFHRLSGGTFWECFSSTDTTNTLTRFRANLNTDGNVRLEWRDGASSGAGNTLNGLYKVVGSNILKTTAGFEVGTNLTVLGTTTFTGSLAAASGQVSITTGLAVTGGTLNMGTGQDIRFATSGAGTKIGGATNELLSFWNATPVTQRAFIAAPAAAPALYSQTWGQDIESKVNALRQVLIDTGIKAAS